MTSFFGLTLSIAIAVTLACTAADSTDVTVASYAFGRKYVSTLTQDQIDGTPDWNEADSNPPVSARKAARLADRYVSEHVTPKAGLVREIESITLAELKGKWYWRIAIAWVRKEGASTGIPDFVEVIVLMDSTVVSPKVTIESP